MNGKRKPGSPLVSGHHENGWVKAAEALTRKRDCGIPCDPLPDGTLILVTNSVTPRNRHSLNAACCKGGGVPRAKHPTPTTHHLMRIAKSTPLVARLRKYLVDKLQ